MKQLESDVPSNEINSKSLQEKDLRAAEQMGGGNRIRGLCLATIGVDWHKLALPTAA